MITRLLCIFSLTLVTLTAAPDPTPEDLLRQGLFEEEANNDLDKAAESYRAVIAAHDRQRALAASATFRLGEIARKKNDNEAAAAAFRTVITRFSEQETLVGLSRGNLTAIGMPVIDPPPAETQPDPFAEPAVPIDPQDTEIARLKDISRNSPDLLDGANEIGWRPLHYAAEKGWTKVIAYLLENKANPNGRTIREQLTPLDIASLRGQLAAVSALIAAKATLDATFEIERDPQGVLPAREEKAIKAKGDWTALDLAVLYDRREIARALIAAGADLKRSGPDLGMRWFAGAADPFLPPMYENRRFPFTSLQLAVELQRDEISMEMLKAGALLTAPDYKDAFTPLQLAVLRNPDFVPSLLKANANPNLGFPAYGITPLHDASNSGMIEMAKLLIAAGADIKAVDSLGRTPLHLTANAEMAELLLSKGADPNARTTAGLTILDVIAERRNSCKLVIETLLKHGATVADPMVLLRRSSPENLDAVRELIVYPLAFNPDAIQLSVSGSDSLRDPSIPPQQGSARQPRPRVGQQGTADELNSRPNLVAIETRSSPASQPPSLAELLREALTGGQFPSIRILRHDATAAFKPILEWSFSPGVPLPETLPALQWGDLVEVKIQNGNSTNEGPPTLGDLAARIPVRNITFLIGGLEIPKAIPGDGVFWLDSGYWQTLDRLFPQIRVFLDQSRFVVHRKDATEPITLDFTEPNRKLFRLIDGDRIEITLNVPELDRQFGDSEVIFAVNRHGVSRSSSEGSKWLRDILGNADDTVDFHKILVLRRAEKWKPEAIDIKALLDALPPKEEWQRDALEASVPKLNPGDVVVLQEDSAKDSAQSANETREKLRSLGGFLHARPPVRPPPTPSGN